ncbi:hypothetical protein WJX73_005303 [Symbiochloris irregularis]|uniref:Histone-lysine N-methyltransferase NSD-like variant PHD zinc finger domain-containing protein n=1 Tax=Symbiochloris irregularis TaxID=706552 RepID=A0AAW1NYN5_9CHLO
MPAARAPAWTCVGSCRRSFHSGCKAPMPSRHVASAPLCSECGTSQHSCQQCGDPSALGRPLIKCSMRQCGRHYHLVCGTSGDSVAMVQCIRCPVGYHARCRPVSAVRHLSKKFIVCPRHDSR